MLIGDTALAIVARHAVPPDTGAVLGAVGNEVVVAYRAARNGTVRVLGRDAATGEVTRRALLPAGFDPAALAAGEDGSVLIAGHRLGDGAVLLSQFAPDGTLVIRVRHRPA